MSASEQRPNTLEVDKRFYVRVRWFVRQVEYNDTRGGGARVLSTRIEPARTTQTGSTKPRP